MAVTGFILVLVGTCLWGTLGPLERQLFSYGVSPVALSLVRAVLPTGVLLLYALCTRKDLAACLFKRLALKIANGFFGIVGLYVLGNVAFLRMPVAQAMIIFIHGPVLGPLHRSFHGKGTLFADTDMGFRVLLHAYPPTMPNLVRLHCLSFTYYCFLQALALQATPLQFGLSSPWSG